MIRVLMVKPFRRFFRFSGEILIKRLKLGRYGYEKKIFCHFLSVLMLGVAGFSQFALGEDTINEDVSISSGKPLSFPQQERIANLAVKALKHIAKARGFIHEDNAADAGTELTKSQKLMGEIRGVSPHNPH